MLAISVTGLSKSFQQDKKALNGVNLSIEQGEMVALIGASGSGKSTLLRHIAGLLKGDPNGGTVEVLGNVMQQNGKIARNARSSRSRIGVVFQQFNLVSRLTVLSNVLIGLLGQIPRWRGTLALFSREEKQRAMAALERVGIAGHATKRASNLSGGQQQRAAIARTLTQGAELILADEPIASLDPASSRNVMKTLERINKEDKITVVVSLHQVDYAVQYCPRTIAMREGEIIFDGTSDKLTPAFLRELYGDESDELFAEKPSEKPKTPSARKEELLLATG
ncbi:phosphonate ABC transporter ATP-binding protein [Sneathiella sp.]|uniref:phosphonate ABC transporter ATP-binding protein n=1 Tax=Sneathiella sp. TaxID=1964365 RepID=UPI0039E4CFCF